MAEQEAWEVLVGLVGHMGVAEGRGATAGAVEEEGFLAAVGLGMAVAMEMAMVAAAEVAEGKEAAGGEVEAMVGAVLVAVGGKGVVVMVHIQCAPCIQSWPAETVPQSALQVTQEVRS